MGGKIIILTALTLLFFSCGNNDNKTPDSDRKTSLEGKAPLENIVTKPLVTFVELGSVNCIPCKKMQPVMKAIEEKYGKQVQVIFYDVWKADQKKYARQYGIRLIPTQVFMDKNGQEIFRHEGFFPEEDIDNFLQTRGINPKKEL